MIDLVYQYDVKITAVEDPSKKKKGATQTREAPKKHRQQIFERFRERNFSTVHMAYSPEKLRLSSANVLFRDPETKNVREYLVDISETEGSNVPFNALKE